mgnify:CR=1 FL=1
MQRRKFLAAAGLAATGAAIAKPAIAQGLPEIPALVPQESWVDSVADVQFLVAKRATHGSSDSSGSAA